MGLATSDRPGLTHALLCPDQRGQEGWQRMISRPEPWDSAAEKDWLLQNRTSVLHKLVTDHMIWVQSLAQFDKDVSLAATWVDSAGDEQVTAINRAFLQVHMRILRSVMRDLIDCGPEGVSLLHHVFVGQMSLRQEGEAG
jgi:hypothetical protein